MYLPAVHIFVFVPNAVLGDTIFFTVFMAVWAAFAVVVLVGVWKSADRYAGHDHWAILAKASVTLSGFYLSVRVMTIWGAFIRAQMP